MGKLATVDLTSVIVASLPGITCDGVGCTDGMSDGGVTANCTTDSHVSGRVASDRNSHFP